MTGLSYTLTELIVTVPELSGFKTTGPYEVRTVSSLNFSELICRPSHESRSIYPRRCLDIKTCDDQREYNNLEVRSVRSGIVGADRNIGGRLRTIWKSNTYQPLDTALYCRVDVDTHLSSSTRIKAAAGEASLVIGP